MWFDFPLCRRVAGPDGILEACGLEIWLFWGHIGPVKRLLPIVVFLLLGSFSAPAVEFEKDVLPILKSNCIKCHKDGKEKGDLNLEPHAIKRHIGSGLQIVPGRPNGGLFMKVIQSEDPENRMPPKGPGLSEREINTLKLWITQGAELGAEEEPVPAGKPPLEGVWTNKEGKKIRAALLRVEGEKAILKLASGKIYKYPISNLDEESQKKVREFAEGSE